METLDDSNGSQKISNGKDEGMETVKLDSSGDVSLSFKYIN